MFSDYEKYISHPINAFGVIKRMSDEDIIKLDDLNGKKLYEKRQLLKNFTKTDIPSQDDVYVACKSLALVQESYNLNTDDFSDGIVNFDSKKIHSQYKLGFKDKKHIGIAAWNRGWLDSGIEWVKKVRTHTI